MFARARAMPGTSRRSNSSHLQFNRRVPLDVAPLGRGLPVVMDFPPFGAAPRHAVSARLSRTHVRFSLGTPDPHVARHRTALAQAHLEALFDRLRSGPARLTHRQIVALSGEVYALVVARFDENPGSPDRWAAWKALNRATREGRLAEPPSADLEDDPIGAAQEALGGHTTATVDAHAGDPARASAALERRFGGLVDWVCGLKGIVLHDDDRSALLAAVERAATDAGWRMKRAALGDYSPDPAAQRFPVWTTAVTASPTKTDHNAGLSWNTLIGAWERAHEASGGPEPTRREWRARITKFGAWSKKLPAEITDDDVRAWRDKRLDEGVSVRTVGDGDLSMIRAVYRYAISEKLLTGANPAADVRVTGMRRAARQMNAFSDDEAATILAAAAAETQPYRRWVPMLCALTGSRVSPMLNLRGCDVQTIDAIACIRIDSEAGPTKTRVSERIVPLHRAIIDAGFLDFVAERGQGRLFYVDRPRRGLGRHNPGSTKLKQLRAWVSSLGLRIGRAHAKDPNHAWRHWLKRALRDAGVSDSVSDAVTGHAPRGDGAAYGGVSLKAMSDALGKVAIPHGRADRPL